MRFRLLIDMDVVDVLSTLSASKRRRLYTHFRKIQKFPGNSSKFVEQDNEGRSLNVSTYEDISIRYLIDDADKHVKILQIVKNE